MDSNEENVSSILTPKDKYQVLQNSTDIENFYRFVHDNDMRDEARKILDALCSKLIKKRKRKVSKVKKPRKPRKAKLQ